MKIEIRYQSKSGNTEKLANAIGKEANIAAKSVSIPLQGACDMLFLGGAIYAGGISGALKRFIKNLDAKQVKTIVVFSTAASGKGIQRAVEKRLKDKGINVYPNELHLKSKDLNSQLSVVPDFVKKALGEVNLYGA